MLYDRTTDQVSLDQIERPVTLTLNAGARSGGRHPAGRALDRRGQGVP